ncbi:MAG: alpha,alpha-trehalase [Flavobacteriales bacterium]|jgi:alpha,alpha-trehalase
MKFKGNIQQTLAKLLAQEDTDGDKKITIEDLGPKSFDILLENGSMHTIHGTYQLSNFLQELALEKALNKTEAVIPLSKIEEAPTTRISRMIRDYFWDDLTRTIDKEGIALILKDEKATDIVQRMYVPASDLEGIAYFQGLKTDFPELEVVVLPEVISPAYVKSINDTPGILALAIHDQKGVPFVVPGGRFNEMYGWDSYFEGVGLLIDGRIDLAKGMVDNFCYQIEHYGKILNANRSYYLTRTQPPFLTSFIREVFEADPSVGKEWLTSVLTIAIQEYKTVWMEQGQRLTENGLNRYYAQGIGIPPETEEGHFDDVLAAFAKASSLPLGDYISKYQAGEIVEPELDSYFTHDRSLRESGHDTSWRLDNICAHLNTVDINSLLYKYEIDFAYLTDTYFDGEFDGYNSTYWHTVARERSQLMNSLMWNEDAGQYFDYNFITGKQTNFESASNYLPLWAGIVPTKRVPQTVKSLMRDLKEKGGIAGSSLAMAAKVPEGAVQRQWDYPNGWAPHQMMIWKGLKIHGCEDELQELVYRWLWMITRNAVDYNGVIPEKYDVVSATHKVFAEYGNVGTEFDYITTSGFGWMNGSYQYGLSILNTELRKQLDALMDPDELFGS